METTNGNKKWNVTQSKQKKSDEKEKQPYIKGLKKSKPNRDDWKKKGVNENGENKYATKLNEIPQANECIKQSKKGKKRKQKPNENKK